MTAGPQLDELAALLGDRSRATILTALLDGRQWTGRELAAEANVTPATASLHLQRLTRGRLIDAVPRGRHKYYRISRPDVAHALETLLVLAPIAELRHPRAIDHELRYLRMCYDHMAGQVAVALSDALIRQGAIEMTDHGGTVTTEGLRLFARLDIALDAPHMRRPVCRPCLDWSERRYHAAGRAGAALARQAIARGWVERSRSGRTLRVTPDGIAGFRTSLGVELPAPRRS